MGSVENIQRKITVDFLVKKIEDSLKSDDGYSRVDRESVKILLEINGYENISKRGLDLYVKKEPAPEVIVNDAQLARYETDIEDVALRKSPTLKEMLSFKNARKILGDSDVLKTVKKDTLSYIRSSFIKNTELAEPDINHILKEMKIFFDAGDFEGFFKLVLVGFEIASLKYIPALSRKYGYYIFAKKFQKENDSFFSCIGLLDKDKKRFLFTKNEIKEKEFDKVLSDEKEDEILSIGMKALAEAGELIESEEYLPFESNLFQEGLPKNLNI